MVLMVVERIMGGMESADNPLAQINENITPYNSNIFMGNAYAKITFYEGVRFYVNYWRKSDD